MTLVDSYKTGNVPEELRTEIERQVREKGHELEEADFPIAAVWGKGGWEIMFAVGLTLAKHAQNATADEPYLIMHLERKMGHGESVTKRTSTLEG